MFENGSLENRIRVLEDRLLRSKNYGEQIKFQSAIKKLRKAQQLAAYQRSGS